MLEFICSECGMTLDIEASWSGKVKISTCSCQINALENLQDEIHTLEEKIERLEEELQD
jgi:transcription initiation factor IIE alpha subunit